MAATTPVVRRKALPSGLKLAVIDWFYTDFSAASTSEGVAAPFTLPADAVLITLETKLVEAFTHGSITAIDASLGDGADADAYAGAHEVLSGPPALGQKGRNFTANRPIASITPELTLAATGGNLGDGTDTTLTAGRYQAVIVYDEITVDR
jgi:hypothetical protein